MDLTQYSPPPWVVAQQQWQPARVPGSAAARVGPGTAGSSTSATAPDYGALALLPQLNQQQVTYPAMGVPGFNALTKTESGNIASLLSPTDFTDQQRLGAEQAVAGGFQGSQFGEENTLKLTEDEKLRRQLLGSQMLSGAVGRLPGPVNPATLLGHTTAGASEIPTGPGGVSYPMAGGGGRAPAASPTGGPPGVMVAPGTAPQNGTMNWLNSILNPAPAVDPMEQWRQSVGLGPTSGSGVDEWGLPLNFNQAELDAGNAGGSPFVGDINQSSDNYA